MACRRRIRRLGARPYATKFANRTLERLYQAGKGVIEFHDTRKVTVDALDSILVNLKANGFKLVQISRRRTSLPRKST